MPKRPPPTIGMVRCGHCQATAAVRKAASGAVYYVCMCSAQPIYASEYILDNATIWGDDGTPPDGVPEWIAKGLRFKPGARDGGDRPRGPGPRGPSAEAEPELPLEVPGPPAGPDAQPRSDPDPPDETEGGRRLRGGLFL